MNPLYGYLVVFLGAGIGGSLRHAINRTSLATASTIPWGTFAINVTGSLVIGIVAGVFAFRTQSSQHLRLFLTTGILGGYTTFSAFSLEVALLWERGRMGEAAAYAMGSVVLSVAAVFLGLALARTG